MASLLRKLSLSSKKAKMDESGPRDSKASVSSRRSRRDDRRDERDDESDSQDSEQQSRRDDRRKPHRDSRDEPPSAKQSAQEIRHKSSRGPRDSARDDRTGEKQTSRAEPDREKRKSRVEPDRDNAKEGVGAKKSDSKQGKPPKTRFFKNPSKKLIRREPKKQLIQSLTRIITEHPPDSVPPGGGFYYGPVSVAYLFFVLSGLYKELEVEGHTLDVWSAAYLRRAGEHMKKYPGPEANRCGVSDDVMTLVAMDAVSTQDAELVKELCDFADIVTLDDAENEWLYGRAGYLYLLRFVKKWFPDNKEVAQEIDQTADEIIDLIMVSPRPWKWHGKAYVGAVHGAIGIITQIVLTEPAWAPKLEADLGAILSYQYDNGNWPSSIPPGRDRLVQVCHGAPGVVISLLSIKKYFPKLDSKIDRAIKRGRACILERGLLTKEACLCHGISGNALALEPDEFEHFLSYTTGHEIKALENDGMLEKSEDPASLWTGEAGRAWAWAVADLGLERRLLGYNDL